MAFEIDFTNCEKRHKKYEGSNGNKISIIYNDELYMLKFPPVSKRNKAISYKNDCISEYIGCHIVESLGLPVQQTLLGTYNTGKEEKIVVACKDITSPGWQLIPFAGLKNETINTPTEGYNTELSEILSTFNEQKDFDPEELREFFWKTFIADSLIGNWDRHNGNWGFLYNQELDRIRLAPLYDCGSSLYPAADEETIKIILSDENEFKVRIYERPYSAIKENGNSIKYYDFISSLRNKDCNKALKEIYPRIDMDRINGIIDDTPYISGTQKLFYKRMIEGRKKLILQPSYEKLIKIEKKKKLARKGHEIER